MCHHWYWCNLLLAYLSRFPSSCLPRLLLLIILITTFLQQLWLRPQHPSIPPPTHPSPHPVKCLHSRHTRHGRRVLKHTLAACVSCMTSRMSSPSWCQTSNGSILMPVNLTNPVDVAAGQPAVYRQRPAYGAPAAHANNTTSAVVNIYRIATTRHTDFDFAPRRQQQPHHCSSGKTSAQPTRTFSFSGQIFRTSCRTCSLRCRSWTPWPHSIA